MAKFLNTSATTYHLEELIKNASERLVLISPFLRFSDKIRELLEDKNRMKIDIRLVYGKSDLHPDEAAWLRSMSFVRCSFCKNLHAKCYLNETSAIITSMNLYEFSQVNNNEMGIFIERTNDEQLFQDTDQEAKRLIRISDEVAINVEIVNSEDSGKQESPSMISTSKLAKSLGIAAKDLFSKMQESGLIFRENDSWKLTDVGKNAGGKIRSSKMYGEYITWPNDLKL